MESYFTNICYLFKSESDIYPSYLQTKKWSNILFINNSFYFNKAKTFVGQLSGQYMTGERTIDRKTRSRYYVNCGVRYKMMHAKCELGLQVQNLLSNDNRRVIYSNDIQKYETEITPRSVKLSIVYNWGVKVVNKNRKYSNGGVENRLK